MGGCYKIVFQIYAEYYNKVEYIIYYTIMSKVRVIICFLLLWNYWLYFTYDGCKIFKYTSNNIHVPDNIWYEVNITKNHSIIGYIYSAYLDLRDPNVSYIRLLAIAYDQYNCYCKVWFSSNQKPISYIENAAWQMHIHHRDYRRTVNQKRKQDDRDSDSGKKKSKKLEYEESDTEDLHIDEESPSIFPAAAANNVLYAFDEVENQDIPQQNEEVGEQSGFDGEINDNLTMELRQSGVVFISPKARIRFSRVMILKIMGVLSVILENLEMAELDECDVAYKLPLNDRGCVLSVDTDRPYLNVRYWFELEDKLLPTKRGIVIPAADVFKVVHNMGYFLQQNP